MFSVQLLTGLVLGAMAGVMIGVVTLIGLWIRDFKNGSLW